MSRSCCTRWLNTRCEAEVGRDQAMVQRTSLDLIHKLGTQEKVSLSGILEEVHLSLSVVLRVAVVGSRAVTVP